MANGGWKNELGERWVNRKTADKSNGVTSAAVVTARLFSSGASGVVLSPTTGHVLTQGKTPTLSQTVTTTLTPTTGHIVASGKIPTLVTQSVLSPTTGHVVTSGKTPTVIQSSSSTTTLSPSSGHVVTQGKTPTLKLDVVLSPSTGHLITQGKIPSVTQSAVLALNPTTGHVLIAGKTPTLLQTANQTLSPSSGHIVTTGRTPVLVQTANQIVVPDTGHVLVKGNIPTVSQAAGYTITLDSLNKLADIWARLGLNISLPVVITPTSIDAGTMSLQLTDSAGVITCARQDATHTPAVDANVMIDEVYKRLGLESGSPMQTQSGAISFAGITLQLSGTTNVTVQRQ